MEELSYVKKYQNVFNLVITDFVSTEVLESKIEERYNKKLMGLDQNKEFSWKFWRSALEIARKQEIDSVLSMKLSKR